LIAEVERYCYYRSNYPSYYATHTLLSWLRLNLESLNYEVNTLPM